MTRSLKDSLAAVASRFHPYELITEIDALGSGNINDTFLVTINEQGTSQNFVMQRLNTDVFNRPDLVMQNMIALGNHVQKRIDISPRTLRGRRWEMPTVVSARDSKHWVEHEGQFWRTITYIGAATTSNVINDSFHAKEVGYGLGMFHNLINDLPLNELVDTLEDFHITPTYMRHYDLALKDPRIRTNSTHKLNSRISKAMDFVEKNRKGINVLELALANGELQKRPIHGDPKINNVMMDDSTGHAIGLIDLDTVRPGLVHYDIGDCLRSCCNRAGEESEDINEVFFDIELCRAILEGYLSVAGSFLKNNDYFYIPDCIRLIPFELGLRFLTDHLKGNTYFKTSRPDHNLDRAEIQFRLTESIENQMPDIISLVNNLTPTT